MAAAAVTNAAMRARRCRVFMSMSSMLVKVPDDASATLRCRPAWPICSSNADDWVVVAQPSVGGGGTEPGWRQTAAVKGADMFTRARLICAGLLAAATTAVLVGAPAMVQAGIILNGLD
jgi:hypothetical protein